MTAKRFTLGRLALMTTLLVGAPSSWRRCT
jgi:hypothetical protein